MYAFSGYFSFLRLLLFLLAGTLVVAARRGLVVSVIHFNKFSKFNIAECPDGAVSCSTPLTDGNEIRVLHDDGTMAVYFHIAYGSAVVKPGDCVEGRQQLALCGTSGFSTTPHIHFEVCIITSSSSLVWCSFFLCLLLSVLSCCLN